MVISSLLKRKRAADSEFFTFIRAWPDMMDFEMSGWAGALGNQMHMCTHTYVHVVRLPWPRHTDRLHRPCRPICASTEFSKQPQWAGPVNLFSFSSLKPQVCGVINAGGELRRSLVQPPYTGLHIHVAHGWKTDGNTPAIHCYSWQLEKSSKRWLAQRGK